ncbi:uncharacterized protein LOC120340632 [Styela clava]
MTNNMASYIFVIICISGFTCGMPAPFEMPINSLVSYYEDKDNDAKANPIPYDNYGAPPDHYPAIIPDMSQSYYDENSTYPGIYDNNECHSVRNCPWELQNPEDPSDPYAPIFLGPGYLGFGLNPDEDRVWKCNVEVDCFAQEIIPEDLSNDTEVLFLRSFNFTTLEIGNLSVLPPLIKLRIEYSDLRTIEPGAFASQPTLEILELEGNDIENIRPSTFIELKDLTNLDLSNNQIQKLRRNMFAGLESVTELSVGSNSLVDLDGYTFAEMNNLEELTIDDNNITFISNNAFSGLPNLKRLYLNHNRLSSVPTIALREPPSLIHLHLTGNPLRAIFRSDFLGLETLETLWLDECELVSIGRRAFHNKKLKMLVLSDNYLTKVPNLGTMRRLQTVRLEHNPWNCDCNMTRTVRWLRRHSLSPQSQDPECATPPHFEGKRVLELSNDDLCSPPPKYIPRVRPPFSEVDRNGVITQWHPQPRADEVNELPPTTKSYERKDTALGLIPEGGWSKLPYDTDKLYSTNIVRDPVKPIPTIIAPSTEVMSTTQLATQRPLTTTELTTMRGSAEHETTRAIKVRETTSTTGNRSVAAISTPATTFTNITKFQTRFITETTEQNEQPNDYGTPISVTIVIGLVVAVIVVITIIVGVLCILQRYHELKAEKQNPRRIEMKTNSSNNVTKSSSSTKEVVENGKVVKSIEGT